MENNDNLPAEADIGSEPQVEESSEQPHVVSEEDAYAAAAAIEEMSQHPEESAEQPVALDEAEPENNAENENSNENNEEPAPSVLEPLPEDEPPVEADPEAEAESGDQQAADQPQTEDNQQSDEDISQPAPEQSQSEPIESSEPIIEPATEDPTDPEAAAEVESPAEPQASPPASAVSASVRPVSSRSRPTSVIEARVPSAVMETDGAKSESPTGRKSVTFDGAHSGSRPTSSASRPVTGSQRINPTPPPRPPSAASRPTSGRPKSSLRQASATASRPTTGTQAASASTDLAQSPIAEEASPLELKESPSPQPRAPSAPASRPQTASRNASRAGTASQAARPASGAVVQQVPEAVAATEEPAAAAEVPITPTQLDIEIRVPASVLGVTGGVAVQGGEAAWRESLLSSVTVDELRTLVAKKIKIHEAAIGIAVDGILIEDGSTALDSFKSKYFQTTANSDRPSFTVMVTVKSHIAPSSEAVPSSHPQEAPSQDPQGEQFDLNVVVPAERMGEQPTVVHVKVEREGSAKSKPFVGGFKNKLTGQQFHNAMTQTASTEHNPKGIEKYHRDAQTVDVITRSQQTTKEAGTQMVRKDLYKDGAEDVVKEVDISRYVTSEELHAIKEDKAIRIQSFLRQCFALRRVRHLRDQRDARVAEEQREKERKEAESQAERQRQIERRVHPRTKEDFEILHGELEAWRKYETERIKNQDLSHMKFASREDRDAFVHKQLQELLLKEVRLLQTIDRLRLEAMKANKEDATAKTLEKLAMPKRWGSRTEPDRAVSVETPYTTRAHDLVELYHGLTLTTLTRTQRLELLHSVKWTVKEFECELTREIEALLDRETDMLNRGRSEASLLGLRKRLNSLFLQFAQTPEFNPEAAALGMKKKQNKLHTRSVKVL